LQRRPRLTQGCSAEEEDIYFIWFWTHNSLKNMIITCEKNTKVMKIIVIASFTLGCCLYSRNWLQRYSVSNLCVVWSVARNMVTSPLLEHITLQDKFLYLQQTFDSCIFSKISTGWKFLFQPAYRPTSWKQELCYICQDHLSVCYLYIILIYPGKTSRHSKMSLILPWFHCLDKYYVGLEVTVSTCFKQFY
jgi:hypothetical protein